MGDETVEIAGKTVVVTGAASGIGFAIAEACLARGRPTVPSPTSSPALDAARVTRSPRATDVIDVRSRRAATGEARRRLRDEVDRAFGGADIVCNNAGVLPRSCRSGRRRPRTSSGSSRSICGGSCTGHARLRTGHDRARTPAHVVNTASMAAIGAAPLLRRVRDEQGGRRVVEWQPPRRARRRSARRSASRSSCRR